MKPGVIPNRVFVDRDPLLRKIAATFVRSFFHVWNARLSSNFRFVSFRFVSFRDYLDETRAKLKFDRGCLSRLFEDYLFFFFFFFGDEGIDLRTREIRINVALWK